MTGGAALLHVNDACVGRPSKAEEKKRKRVGFSLDPKTVALLPLIADKLEMDAVSRVLDDLVDKEARRLKIRIK